MLTALILSFNLMAEPSSRHDDCMKAINAMLAERGELQTWAQWSRYADWTHAEQCTQELSEVQ